MPRILGIDYGQKRSGIAVTDPLQIIVNGLLTVDTSELFEFLKSYLQKEQVETYLTQEIRNFGEKLKGLSPDLNIDFHDDSFTSHTAKSFLVQSGMKKSKRRDKAELDKMSAVVILQEYLKHI